MLLPCPVSMLRLTYDQILHRQTAAAPPNGEDTAESTVETGITAEPGVVAAFRVTALVTVRFSVNGSSARVVAL